MILSENDLKLIRKAMNEYKDIMIERTLGTKKIKVVTSHVSPKTKVWKCGMIVTLRVKDGCISSIQHFESVDEMIRIRGDDI